MALRGYRLILWKFYFDEGLGLTSYFKYLLAFLGIFNLISARDAIFFLIGYIFICFVIGYMWANLGFKDTANEIQNRFNPFQKEIRKRLKKRFK